MLKICSLWHSLFFEYVHFTWIRPNNFCDSIIAPVLKDKNDKSDAYDTCKYRPISLVTMSSKIFKLCGSARIVLLLRVNDLQFGFVP